MYKILIVEDDEVISEEVKRHLEKWDIHSTNQRVAVAIIHLGKH